MNFVFRKFMIDSLRYTYSYIPTHRRGAHRNFFRLSFLCNFISFLQEDELKLNNVFYKLGRHDTDIQATTNDQIALRKTAQKLEAKLNKQSFNVSSTLNFKNSANDRQSKQSSNHYS